jgi:hypothetical protein
LLNHRFDSFNHLVDAALNTERKRREIEDKKRKMAPSLSGSNTRPLYQRPQQQRPPQQYQQWQQFPPRPQQQVGQGQRLPAPPAPPAPRQGVPTPPGQQAAALPRVCFHCGEPGHYANVCLRKAQAG